MTLAYHFVLSTTEREKMLHSLAYLRFLVPEASNHNGRSELQLRAWKYHNSLNFRLFGSLI